MNEARDLNWRTTARSRVSRTKTKKKTKNTNTNAQNADKDKHTKTNTTETFLSEQKNKQLPSTSGIFVFFS